MQNSLAKAESPTSQFFLLLRLKFLLIRRGYAREKSGLLGTILMVVVLLPFSLGLAYFLYTYASSTPGALPYLLRDVLTAAYLFWFLGPIFGVALNQSYDPTKLFVYPVPYQTIFAANVVGSLFETTTLLFLPLLVALLLASATTSIGFIAGIFLLLLFMLQTVALGQAVTLALIGLLRSRRFRDIMIVFFPLIAILRYVLTPRFTGGNSFSDLLNGPFWKFANYIPPGWTASAMIAAQSGNYLRASGLTAALIFIAAGTVGVAVTVLRQLYTGERGTSLIVAKARASAPARSETSSDKVERDLVGVWKPIQSIVQKEWRYFIRDPQYKAMGSRILYLMVVFGFTFARANAIGHNPFSGSQSGSAGIMGNLIHLTMPMDMSAFLLLAVLPLTFNIFGGEGAAVTMFFSFPTPRRHLFFGKNVAHGTLIFAITFIGVCVVSYLTHSLSTLPLITVWLFTATLVLLGAGNLVSVRFPTKLVLRGGLLSRGGQMSVGTSQSPGAGCAYSLLYLAIMLVALVLEIPTAVAIIVPGIGLISTSWYFLTIPLALLYSVGLYALSIYLTDSWMVNREYDIIQKLASTD